MQSRLAFFFVCDFNYWKYCVEAVVSIFVRGRRSRWFFFLVSFSFLFLAFFAQLLRSPWERDRQSNYCASYANEPPPLALPCPHMQISRKNRCTNSTDGRKKPNKKTNKQTKTIRRWNGKAKEKKKNRHVPVVWRLYSFLYFFFNSTFLVGFQYKINLQRVVFLRVFLYRRFFAGRHRIFLFVFSFLFFWRVGRREGAICMSFA